MSMFEEETAVGYNVLTDDDWMLTEIDWLLSEIEKRKCISFKQVMEFKKKRLGKHEKVSFTELLYMLEDRGAKILHEKMKVCVK